MNSRAYKCTDGSCAITAFGGQSFIFQGCTDGSVTVSALGEKDENPQTLGAHLRQQSESACCGGVLQARAVALPCVDNHQACRPRSYQQLPTGVRNV